ncbi:biopolymer transport protein [Pelotomaculum thermopropionicum SI]|uniref:Biopolymer transport protein n=1 Tax=Pelotomaculum thermopropionicum (strain DSM 13744 / JCM 10971 / SI) TaxID=370438 RepID=A5CZW2_PELTS|nr:biopolymer transport protein [Pelotomaculum thermopropionicum SI]
MGEAEKKPMTRREFEEQIIKKAQSDKEFKQDLVNNPKEALGKLGVRIPEEVEVKVVEESPRVFYLVLPVNPDELTDSQLDGVAGGICFIAGEIDGKGACGIDTGHGSLCFMKGWE